MKTKLICPTTCTRRFDCDVYHEPEPRCPDAIPYRVQPVVDDVADAKFRRGLAYFYAVLVVAGIIAGIAVEYHRIIVDREQIPQTSIVLMEGGK